MSSKSEDGKNTGPSQAALGPPKSDDTNAESDLAAGPGILNPLDYPVERGEEELKCIKETMELVMKTDPTLLKRYRTDPHKISRIVMREVRPKNGFNVPKAARFYKETVEWRESFGKEYSLIFPPFKRESIYMPLFPDWWGAYDRQGYPVLIVRFGHSSGRTFLDRVSTQEFEEAHAYSLDMMEYFCRLQTKKLGRWVDKIRVILDFKGVSLFALKDFLGYAKRMSRLGSTYFTGAMLSTIVVNIPTSLNWCATLFWPFIPAGVKRKVKIFGTSGFQSALNEIIDLKQLPKQYGGSREWKYTEPDKYDWKTHDEAVKRKAKQEFKLKRVALRPGAEHKIELDCAPGTLVDYYFESTNSSLQFEVMAVFAKDKRKVKAPVPLVEKTSRKCNVVPERSSFRIYGPAKVRICWTAPSGWMSKEQNLILGVKTSRFKVPQSDGVLGHLRLEL